MENGKLKMVRTYTNLRSIKVGRDCYPAALRLAKVKNYRIAIQNKPVDDDKSGKHAVLQALE